MLRYNCDVCDVMFIHASNYSRHKKSRKHKTNIKTVTYVTELENINLKLENTNLKLKLESKKGNIINIVTQNNFINQLNPNAISIMDIQLPKIVTGNPAKFISEQLLMMDKEARSLQVDKLTNQIHIKMEIYGL